MDLKREGDRFPPKKETSTSQHLLHQRTVHLNTRSSPDWNVMVLLNKTTPMTSSLSVPRRMSQHMTHRQKDSASLCTQTSNLPRGPACASLGPALTCREGQSAMALAYHPAGRITFGAEKNGKDAMVKLRYARSCGNTCLEQKRERRLGLTRNADSMPTSEPDRCPWSIP